MTTRPAPQAACAADPGGAARSPGCGHGHPTDAAGR